MCECWILTNMEVRVRAGISRAALARFLDLPQSNVWRIEHNNTIPNTPKGRKYEMALQLMENHGMVNYVPCPTVILLREKKRHRI